MSPQQKVINTALRHFIVTNNVLKMCRNSEMNIILKDINTKVGYQQYGYTVGKCGLSLGERIGRRNILVEETKEQDMLVKNTWFQQNPRKLWAWNCSDNKLEKQKTD